MNRTIKFRGKGLYSGKWIEGYYVVNRGEHFIAPDEFVNPLAEWTDYQVDPDTIGQFTGIVDKNGTEIYEGDVVLVYDTKHCVIYEEGAFMLDDSFEACYLGSFDVKMYVVVIGNIHDNPEPIN